MKGGSSFFLLEFADGSVARTEVSPGRNVDQVLAKTIAGLADIGEVVAVHPVDASQLPADRTFRNAWRHCPTNGVRTCMHTARAMHKDRIRARRKERFAESDAVLTGAILGSRDASAVSDFVQMLRDAPADPAIADAQTPEDLAMVWPGVLEAAVPALGARIERSAGSVEAPAYDTRALEDWAKGMQAKVAQLEQERTALAEGTLQALNAAHAAALDAQKAVARAEEATAKLANVEKALDVVIDRGLDLETFQMVTKGAQS